MLSFNYLPERRSLRDIMTRWLMPPPLRLPLHAIAALVLFGVMALLYESTQLREARNEEQTAASEYAAQAAAVRNAKDYERHVRSLMKLDAEVRRAAESGTVAAGRLAAVARDLPEDAWLTAIRPDSTGLALDGMAADLSGVRRTLLGLGRDPRAGEPELQRTELEENTNGASLVHFLLHLPVARN